MMRRSAWLLCLLVCSLAGCAAPDPKPMGGGAEDLDRAIREADASLDAAPLEPARLRQAARARFALARFGRADALDRAALWLLDHPAAVTAGAMVARADLEEDALSAERGGIPVSTGAPGPNAHDRHLRSRDEALRLYREKRYAEALEKLEKLTPAEDPKASRWIASCHMKLAAAASDEGRPAEAIEHLWRAADADAAARAPILYRDVARLERRLSVDLQARGDPAGVIAALRRAFRAAPGDPETLYLLTRRADLPAPEKAYYETLMATLYPKRAAAEFALAARRVREAPDAGAAAAAVDHFAHENPTEIGLLADLRSVLAERSTGEAVKDAASARARFETALEDARQSRTAFDRSFQPAAEAPDGSPAPAPAPPAAGE